MTATERVDLKPATRPGADAEPTGRRSGPAAAVVLAAGIACFTLGLLSILTAASGAVSDAMTLSDRVGDVSGLSVVTAATYFIAWGALAIVWRRANPPLARIAAASGALVGVGLLGTFPPFFNVFGG